MSNITDTCDTERKLAEEALRKRLEFEHLVADTSNRFANIEADKLDNAINDTLAAIGDYTGVDRSYIIEFSIDLATSFNTHEWCAGGIKPEIQNLQDIPLTPLKWWMRKMKSGESIVIRSVPDLPEMAQAERELLQAQGILSLLAVPMICGNGLYGFIGFDSVQNVKKWEIEDIRLLQTVSETISNAIKRIRNETALRESEDKFSKAFHDSPSFVFITDLETGEYIEVNKAYCDLTGYSAKELIGNTSLKLGILTPGPRAFMVDQLNRYGMIQDDEGQIKTKKGEIRTRILSAALIDIKGRHCIIASGLDITGRKKTEQELKRLNETLEQQVTQRTAMAEERARQLQQLALELSNAEDKEHARIATILHDDLQQHLAAIRFNLYTLIPDEMMDDKVKDRLGWFESMINKGIEKCRSLSHELSPPVLHQSGFLAALHWLVQDVQEKHGQQVALKSVPEAQPESTAMASILFRSVRELLFNALKHSGTTAASIEADIEGDFIRVSVKDHGQGFDCDVVKARANDAPGFGLFNIEERINYLGGRFEIESKPGNGCCVTLRVPKQSKKVADFQIEHRPSAAPVKVADQHVPGQTDGIRIMLVDDHASMRETMTMFFEQIENFDVVAQAANGLEAVQIAKQLNPDVILMDVSMPKMGGIEATSLIKAHQPNVRIIGLSMHDDEKTKERMLSAGASAYISKAAPVKEILELIRRLR